MKSVELLNVIAQLHDHGLDPSRILSLDDTYQRISSDGVCLGIKCYECAFSIQKNGSLFNENCPTFNSNYYCGLNYDHRKDKTAREMKDLIDTFKKMMKNV